MSNIKFKIGQPNTGKSYGFEKKQLQKTTFKDKELLYKKIPVSGGVGNEYKGLQNTDLALSYDPINKTIRFGEFLQMLISAIIQPEVEHVVFLDDFHNQDISSLLSEYTPLFKNQQMRDLKKQKKKITITVEELKLLESEEFDKAEEFIVKWNEFIDTLVDVPLVPITNRISGSSLKLVFPANFHLYGAANFNEKTLNIFADWADRAEIEIINPIKVQENDEHKDKLKEGNSFVTCCKSLNNNLKNVLEKQHIFDFERYCFGIWKVVNEKGELISDTTQQKKIINFFFSMIKNSLVYNNKNSYINFIGWELIKSMQNDPWFKENIPPLDNPESDIENDDVNGDIFKVLHEFSIYDN